MKYATAAQIAKGRKVYINIHGQLMSEGVARQYYGSRFETAILAKVVVDEDGNTIGTW